MHYKPNNKYFQYIFKSEKTLQSNMTKINLRKFNARTQRLINS